MEGTDDRAPIRPESRSDSHSEIRVARPLELSTIQVAVAVVALARELDAPSPRWTLGDHGSFELDRSFSGLTLGDTTRRGEQRISSRGRLWSADGMVVSSAD